jgi:ATP-dependent DNA helicase RecG
MYNWQTKIQAVRGVGPVRAKELAGLGVTTVGDLLEYRPSDYIFPGTTPIRDLRMGEQALIQGTVIDIRRLPTPAPIVAAIVEDETGKIGLTWFNQIYLLNSIQKGTKITVWGKVSVYKGFLQFSGPKFSTCNFKQNEVAGGLYGVHSETIRTALRAVLADVEILDWINPNLCDRADAFYFLHFPENKQQLEDGLERLKFDELFIQQMAVAIKRRQQARQGAAVMGLDKREQVLRYFPHKLTNDQTQVIADICSDLSSGRAMRRLLQGEVASGKTYCAFFAAMLVALNNKRTVILVPTTILAQQHFDTLKNFGRNDCCLWLGGIQPDPGYLPKIIIGTTAILSRTDILKLTSLVIVDEQHKFGTQQRAILQKYGNPHLLMLSATPIPRTLVQTVFGDLDISTIREMPIKRGAVVTRWVLPDRREGVYEVIDEQLKQGRQVYIVYPRIASGEEDMTGVAEGYCDITRRFADYSVASLTGRDISEVKTDTLRKFKSGEYNILVSTVIAEVGLDCPNATVMLIEGADRFGLSQLHQLRGRIARSTETAFCFLMASTANDTSIARLRTLEKTNDGFEIAEADLRLRGPGELFNTRQHGLPDLKFASLVNDYDLLLEARELAKNSLDKLNTPEYNGVRKMLEIKFPKLDIVGVG